MEGTRERVRLEAGRLGRRLRQSARTKAVEAWARRGRGGQVPGSAFPAGRGERGLDQPGGPSGADQGPGQRPSPSQTPGAAARPATCPAAEDRRAVRPSRHKHSPQGRLELCLCPRCGSSVKLLASLDPRFFIHKVAIITSSSHVTARWQGTSLPSQGYPGAAPAGGHVRDWPQAGLTAEKRQTPHWDHTVP